MAYRDDVNVPLNISYFVDREIAQTGKKRMRQFGKVEIPQEAFIAALKMGGEGRAFLSSPVIPAQAGIQEQNA